MHSTQLAVLVPCLIHYSDDPLPFYRSVVAGAMWFTNEGQQLDIRHTCEHGDHLQKYGWTHHDGTTFGQQEILDDCTYKHHIAKSDLGLMCVCVPCHFFSAKHSLPFTRSHFSKHRCCDSVTALPWGHMDGKVCPQTTDRPTQAGLPHPLRLQRRTWRDGLRQVTKELNRRNLWTYTRGMSGEREREREISVNFIPCILCSSTSSEFTSQIRSFHKMLYVCKLVATNLSR